MKALLFAGMAAMLMATAAPAFANECHWETQCSWKNFKKHCVKVKVCR